MLAALHVAFCYILSLLHSYSGRKVAQYTGSHAVGVYRTHVLHEKSDTHKTDESSLGTDAECCCAMQGSAQISWKNVFDKQVEFFYSVDNSAFSVKALESLAAKKTTTIAVTYKEDASRPRTAKLMIACPAEAAMPWVFYLQA